MFVISDLSVGRILRNTSEFVVLQDYAQTKLEEIQNNPEAKGFFGKVRTHIAFSKLNARLSFYGWAIDRMGKLFEVRVRGELPVKMMPAERPDFLSVEEMEEITRSAATETGHVIDPMTGKKLPKSHLFKCGGS